MLHLWPTAAQVLAFALLSAAHFANTPVTNLNKAMGWAFLGFCIVDLGILMFRAYLVLKQQG